MNLLVVDYDYFLPTGELEVKGQEWELWDWGHSEAWGGGMLDQMWSIRAAGFLRNGFELPMLDEELLAGFWSRFNFAPRTQLFYAESNSQAFHERVSRSVNELWLFDAHHDSGYQNDAKEKVIEAQQVSCEDWMIPYELLDTDLHMRYPKWRQQQASAPDLMDFENTPDVVMDRQYDDGARIDHITFDRIFVCRSGSWVPSWTDDSHFFHLITSAPAKKVIALDDPAIEPRVFDMDAALAINQGFAEQDQGLVS